MKTLQIALVLFGFCSLASADIHKYVDPGTGAVEYTNQPKRGSTRMSTSDTISEIPGAAVSGYKCPGEPGRDWEVRATPAIGCYRIDDNVGITTEQELSDERGRLNSETAQREALVAALIAKEKKRVAAAAELNKKWPGACVLGKGIGWICFPRVGMLVDTHDFILDLMPSGYSEDATGKVERYSRASCRVTARRKLIIAVSC